MTNAQRQIASNIAALLGLMGWRQTDLARATGIADATVSRKMRGMGDWSLTDLDRMASALGVTIAELVGRIPDAQEWDRRRRPAAALGPRYLVMPESDLSTPPLNHFAAAMDIMSLRVRWAPHRNHTGVVPHWSV